MRSIAFYVNSCACVHSCGVDIGVNMVERGISNDGYKNVRKRVKGKAQTKRLLIA